MARVLFIDFDGVLHRAGNGIEQTGPHFIWLPLLAEELAEHPDVALVVHSTWRYQYTLDELRELLAAFGRRVIGVAPRGPRWDAIKWFLQLNPHFTTYRILDDESKEFEPRPDELVLCDPSLGVTTPGVLAQVARWLADSRAT